ncbi:hypothetical protein [uncultured Selenomonas sp.]|uniref:hypothetical protein n=1 Tax=uncultured Selenomonas sp. TaxID=159275 RepID=UPI0028EF9132|nr:hypothetical protein [uncultured Selenomonas sp.]
MSTQNNDKSFAGLPCNEQETVICIDRETRAARIYTSDTRFINKLDKLYERKRVHRNEDGITAVEYEVAEKLISFRSGKTTRVYTDEERAALSERMKKMRANNA